MDRRYTWIVAAIATGLQLFGQQHHIPQQPIPFSHKQHSAIPLKCADCHTTTDSGKLETIPAASQCMACHVSIATDKPAIQELKKFADSKQPIPWARVYQIPTYVIFSHQRHLEAGFTCAQCHGPVAERDALWKETDLSMDGCMACHKAHKGGVGCTSCHEGRQ